MTWLDFVLGFVLGYLSTRLVLALMKNWRNDKYFEEYPPLDSSEEYVDNTPTFR